MKIIIISFALLLSSMFVNAQKYYNIDILKLDKAFSQTPIVGFTYDTVAYYYGLIATYKLDYEEIVISINSIDEMKDKYKEDKNSIQSFTKDSRKLKYFENDVISVLYYDMPEMGITFYITTMISSKEYLEQLLDQLNPDVLLKDLFEK